MYQTRWGAELQHHISIKMEQLEVFYPAAKRLNVIYIPIRDIS